MNKNVSSEKLTDLLTDPKYEELRQKLSHSYQLLQYIIDNDLNSIAVLDNDLRYIFASKKVIRDYGIKQDDLLGKSHYDIFHDLPEAWKEVHQRALHGEVISSDEDSFVSPAGKVEWVKWECRPWYESDNKIGGIILYTEVITKQKEIELELLKEKEKAEESDRLKTAFLQNISHEVRTPLNSIVGFAELLSEPGLPVQKMASFSKIISANSNKLIGIISDVIEISEIQSGQVRIVNSEFDIISLLNKVADPFREITFLKEVDFTLIQKIPEEKSKIISDKGKLEKIFAHLIDNAVKFTHKGSIRMTIEIIGYNLNIVVADTGIGIAQDKQKIIFEPFRQVESGLNRSYGGTGLGLTIVKSFTEALKGTVTLSSDLNRGTTVSVSIPVSGRPKDNQSEGAGKHTVNTILIAEDEYTNFKYLYEVLHSENTVILHAKNGKEALDICKNSRDIQIILMDLKMPVMDGTSAAKLIREFNPGIPIIAQSAYIPEDENVNSVFDDTISKPINRVDLRQKMRKYIEV